jgi:hypothetical protein
MSFHDHYSSPIIATHQHQVFLSFCHSFIKVCKGNCALRTLYSKAGTGLFMLGFFWFQVYFTYFVNILY